MPLWTPRSRRSYILDNWGTNPSSTPGTSVTPGASDVEGSWTASGLGTVANECQWIQLRVSDGSTATAAKRHVLDIGIDPAGGSSYTAVISDIVCGASATIAAGGAPGHSFLIPFRVPASATVGIRIQGSNATAGTVRVGMRLSGRPDAPWMFPVGQYAETIGVTGSSGTSVTPGNAADGSWASLGTTTRECWWWQLCYQIDNGTITGEYTYLELAYGDGSNKHVILRRMHGGNTSEGVGTPLDENLSVAAAYCRVPAGATLYARGRCNNAPDTGYQCAALGIGG
jgi:hypothetical protein